MLSFLQVYTYKNHFYRKHKQEQIEKEVNHVENEPVLMITDECMQHEDDPAEITGGDNDNRKANAFRNVLMTLCVVPVNWCATLLSQLEPVCRNV